MAETLVSLEKPAAHRFYYAPFARVAVEGQDLLGLGLEMISVSLDSALKEMDQFTFVINNAFDIDTREFISKPKRLDEFFSFGRRVEIFMGYLDKPKLMQTGIITSFRTSYPANGIPQITVGGHDLSYCMGKGKKSKSWNDKKDSDVVAEIAGKYGLDAKVEDTEVQHNRIEQSQQTDYEFISKKLGADRNGFELYVRNKTLIFKAPANDEGSLLTLEWGAGLVSFTPEINLAEQITKVEVAGWDVRTKREIIGRAQIGDEPGRDAGRRSGGQYLTEVCRQSEQPAHRVRLSVRSQQEANRNAKAILTKVSEGLVKGSGESIGVPELRPDINVELKGLGAKFSKVYYVEKTMHTVDSSGYKTTFNVKDTTI